MKKTVKLILLLAWMALIYSFSAAKGDDSALASSQVSGGIYLLLRSLLPMDLATFIIRYEGLIRKLAHLFLYAVLGILAWLNMKEYTDKVFIASLLLCVLYACSDEFHQLFVYERSGNLFDIMVDAAGSLCGIFFCHLAEKICKKRY